MLINKIIKMKNNKYKIIINGDSIITYDNVILENDLLYKKSIDKNLYIRIIEDTKYYHAYNRVVNYILKRRRSEKEVIIYLNKLEIDDSKINNIIKKLKQINFINDTEYAKAYINDKIYLGKMGINKIKKDLLNQNISLNVIDNLLNNIDNDIIKSKLESIIIKKIKLNSKYSNSYLKQKILNEMIDMGYNRDDILNILEENVVEDKEILNKEFNKVYNNLSKKHSGYNLENKVKQKLISKGFKIDEINQLLQEKTEN